MILPSTTYNRFLTLFVIALVLIAVGLSLAWCHGRGVSQKRDAVVAKTTGKALDKVAEQTPVIRAEQKAKEDEVETIQGSDQRLPDGFASSLERVRRGERH